MSVNLYELKAKLKIILSKRVSSININKYPFDFAWITYAFSKDYKSDSKVFNDSMKKLERWSVSELAGRRSKDLSPLSLCFYLTTDEKIKNIIIIKSKKIIENLKFGIVKKFSILNDPIQVFSLTLSLYKNFVSFDDKLIEIASHSIKGHIIRRIFYLATLNELKFPIEIAIRAEEAKDIEDKIVFSWFSKKYLQSFDQKEQIHGFLNEINNSIDFILMDIDGTREQLSDVYLALLYEYLILELERIDPHILYDNYPIHPEIKRISRDYFENQKYVGAIFESIKKLIDFIVCQTNISETSETKIVKNTMNPIKIVDNKRKLKDSSEILILFNSLYNSDLSAQNEQEGIALLAEGVIKAFRHPKGHKPENHELVHIDAYQALDQLILISYLWKRIENAEIKSM